MTIILTTRSWRAVAVSEVGAAHVRDDVVCQDACGHVASSSALIACVADGAGSASHSALGAQAAVDEFIDKSIELRNSDMTPADIARQAFYASRNAVINISEGRPRRYATTLLGLIAFEYGWAAVQIGDGAIVVDGRLAIESSHSGEYVNETVFITNLDAEPDTACGTDSLDRVAMITDGLEGVALAPDESGHIQPYHRFYEPLYRWFEDVDLSDADHNLREFLTSERLRSRTQDDVTLLLAMR